MIITIHDDFSDTYDIISCSELLSNYLEDKDIIEDFVNDYKEGKVFSAIKFLILNGISLKSIKENINFLPGLDQDQAISFIGNLDISPEEYEDIILNAFLDNETYN